MLIALAFRCGPEASGPRPSPRMPPARTPRYYWEDFPVGRVLDVGSTTVSRDEVLAFAARYDPQPFHLDDEAAAASLFGRLSASGWHTASMTMRVMCDGYLLDSAGLGSPGIENLKWVKPVHPGDTLAVRMDVLEARASASRPSRRHRSARAEWAR